MVCNLVLGLKYGNCCTDESYKTEELQPGMHRLLVQLVVMQQEHLTATRNFSEEAVSDGCIYVCLCFPFLVDS